MANAIPLECCCCGQYAGRWQQHWNRDDGYGICAGCIIDARARGTSEDEIKSLYGVEGVNYPPIVVVNVGDKEAR